MPFRDLRKKSCGTNSLGCGDISAALSRPKAASAALQINYSLAAASRALPMKRRIFSASLRPGLCSTPLATSTA